MSSAILEPQGRQGWNQATTVALVLWYYLRYIKGLLGYIKGLSSCVWVLFRQIS